MGLEAIARGPVGVPGEGVVVEEPEPVIDALLGDRVHRYGADLREPFGGTGEALGRLTVVPSVVPDCLLRVRPGVAAAPVGHECVGDGVDIAGLDTRVTPEAFDVHR